MNVKIFKQGFNYSQDGPGNRLVIHMQGCNLHCPWCCNPEGMSPFGGTEVTVEKAEETILSGKRLYFDGGGVTFTGGECTLQKDALKRMLSFCKSNGIDTAIETNGTFDMPSDFYELIDLIICDFKHYDEEKARKIIGYACDYKKNVADYLENGKSVLVRTVLINKFNVLSGGKDDGLDEESVASSAERFALFFEDKKTTTAAFEFLPYHEFGKVKWQKLGKDYKMNDAFVADGTREIFERVFKKYNLRTVRS